MAIEVGALTLAVGIDQGTVMQQLRNIDQAVARSAERGNKLNRLAATQYVSWWKDVLRQREADERRVSTEQAVLARRSAAEYASWWKSAIAERTAAEAGSERRSSDYWMARRRYLRGYQAEYTRLLVERDRMDAASERQNASFWMQRMRQERQLTLLHSQALRMDAARTAAQQKAASRAAATAAKAAKPPVGPKITGPSLSTVGITGTLAGTLAVAEIARAANEMQIVQQRLAQVSASGQEAAIAFDRLSAGAQKLRQPLGETVELYTKLRQSNANVQMSADETIKVTQAFSAALRISGATGQTAASAMLQFGQAMAKGKLDGDEFRTVAENASEVLRVLERNLGLSRAQLLQMREEGKLTSKMLADALLKDFDSLTDRATKLAPSLSQAGVALRNSMLMALTNTTSAREAIESLAKTISGLADFLSENGALIVNIGKLAVGLFAAKKAFDLLQAAHAAYVAFAATTMGPLTLIAGVFTAIATAIAYANSVNDKRIKQQNEEITQVKTLYEAEKIRQRIIKETVAQQQLVAKLKSGPVKSEILLPAEAKLAEKMAQLEKINQQMIALREMSSKPVVSTANFVTAEEAAKKAAEALDEMIAALTALGSAHKATSAEVLRGIVLFERESKVFDDSTQSIERRAKAMQRMKALEDAGMGGFAAKPMTAAEWKAATTDAEAAIDNYIEMLRKKAEIGKNIPLLPKPKDIEEPELDANTEMWVRLKENINQIFSEAPTEVFVSFFEGLGKQFAQGGNSLAETMRKTFGGIFSSVGQTAIRMGMNRLWKHIQSSFGSLFAKMGATTSVFGKLLTSLQSALLNPLVSGPALLAIGAAMVAYGAKMGAIGGGGSGGGDISGTIGGLNTGGGQKPLIYTFGNTQNPLSGARTAADRASGVTVNATIIGPNDPQAQSQIARLVDNAARRGLFNGSGMRTG